VLGVSVLTRALGGAGWLAPHWLFPLPEVMEMNMLRGTQDWI
jgi:hypothetical protein